MIFHFEPTGTGIRIALPVCGHLTGGPAESVSWAVRVAPGERPRLRNKTELKDVLHRAIVKRARASQERVGRVWCRKAHDAPGVAPDEVLIELNAPDDVFATISQLARDGMPPSLALEPEGAGSIWDTSVDPQIKLRGWRAEVQVRSHEEHEAAAERSPLNAQLARIRKYAGLSMAAAWGGAVATALLLFLRLQ